MMITISIAVILSFALLWVCIALAGANGKDDEELTEHEKQIRRELEDEARRVVSGMGIDPYSERGKRFVKRYLELRKGGERW